MINKFLIYFLLFKSLISFKKSNIHISLINNIFKKNIEKNIFKRNMIFNDVVIYHNETHSNISFNNIEDSKIKQFLKYIPYNKNIVNFANTYLDENLLESEERMILNSSSMPESIDQIDQIILNDKDSYYYRFGKYPKLEFPNENGELTWYPIGTPNEFKSYKATLVKIRDINYAVWKDKNGTYYCIRDACSHQGASLSRGTICNDLITCPYHAYNFNGSNGNLHSIPHYDIKNSENFNINTFKVVEKKGIVYLNTIPLIGNVSSDMIDENKIWIEPEAYNNTFKDVLLQKKFLHYAKFVTINSLDICHISYVHTFGNKNSPNPINKSIIEKVNDNKYHFKVKYQYIAGENSLVSKIFNFKELEIENEFILPHTTVARVKFGPYTSTIITTAVPISKFITKLYVKSYRNYWYINLLKDIYNPYYYLINNIGNYITTNMMDKTLEQDKVIIDHIDKYDYESMHGKFNIKYDKLSNLYKQYYKKFYENGKNEI